MEFRFFRLFPIGINVNLATESNQVLNGLFFSMYCLIAASIALLLFFAAHSTQSGHLFHVIPAGYSTPKRPPIPVNAATPVGA